MLFDWYTVEYPTSSSANRAWSYIFLFRSLQCFRQTAPLQESNVAFREGPQKNGERANLARYFYKAACRLNPGTVF